MNQTLPNTAVALYIERLERLYQEIEEHWLPAIDPKAKVHPAGEVHLDEEMSGPYEAPSIEIEPASGISIRLEPRACYVIAASGRLDAVSDLGREIMVYIEGKPSMETTISAGEKLVHSSSRPLRRQTGDGWTWVRDVRAGDVPQLDCATFERLVKELSE